MQVSFLLPLAVAVALVFGSPYAAQIRGALQSAFPGGYRLIIGGIVLAATLVAVTAALERLRRWRHDSHLSGQSEGLPLWVRYSLIGGAVAAGAAYASAVRTGTPEVDLVEAFHFVEYGVVAFLFYRALRSRADLSRVVFAGCAALLVGITDEFVQWFVPARVGEMHDVSLNAAAIGCGLLVSVAVDPPRSWSLPARPQSRRGLGAAVAAVLVGVTVFIDRVHLGYEVRDSAVVFRSQFDEVSLAAAAADRTIRWQTAPPSVGGFTREDHYFSEGLWHVQRRNLAVTAGNGSAAWHENAILERFYTPVLDRGSRWAPEQRAWIEHNAGAAVNGVYVSDAAPYPIFVLHRRVLWTVALLLTGAVLWCFRAGRLPVSVSV